ncbi:MAG TPA: phospholipid carrier-dependent glycosyltransferase, partial [Thermoanaerobaculia bacterium]|nr:phospholipid carrier-dependent glycosyltransferase [Thermoanaerobaculia bacterium]
APATSLPSGNRKTVPDSPRLDRLPFEAKERLLLVALLALLAAVWLEPPRSWLAEPDEYRYAEIPREMLETGDFVTPLLNGVPYFEKPPLLYWANAASLTLLGQTPWAARLPTRLAGLATAVLLLCSVGRRRGGHEGLVAGVLFLMSPLVFTFSRLNLTDGMLTFFFTATLFSARATIGRAEAGRPTGALSALTGALAAAAFLSKGLIGIVLPGGILLLWCLSTGQTKRLKALLLGPAVPVFAILAAPWLWLAERRHPGFLQFFFIHEHFQRFATPASQRSGPTYYFLVVFLAGFLPTLPFFFSGLSKASLRQPETLFFLLWFAVVLVFFSLSQSKLSPYLFPAFPAAAALAAQGFERRGASPLLWRIQALLAFLLVASVLWVPAARSALSADGISLFALPGAGCLLGGSFAAYALRRRPRTALAVLAAGWAGLYVSLALIWPHMALAADIPALARAAKTVAAEKATIVSYKTYLQGFPWELKKVVPLADHKGELEFWFLSEERQREIFWSPDRFWREWRSGRPLVVLLRNRDREDFRSASPPAALIAERGKNCLVANFAIEAK